MTTKTEQTVHTIGQARLILGLAPQPNHHLGIAQQFWSSWRQWSGRFVPVQQYRPSSCSRIFDRAVTVDWATFIFSAARLRLPVFNPSRRQTRSKGNLVASEKGYSSTNSWSCKSLVSSYSWHSAITLASQHEFPKLICATKPLQIRDEWLVCFRSSIFEFRICFFKKIKSWLRHQMITYLKIAFFVKVTEEFFW